MIQFGTILLMALAAALLAWFVKWLCGRLGIQREWIVFVLVHATLIYFFWFFTSGGVIVIGK